MDPSPDPLSFFRQASCTSSLILYGFVVFLTASRVLIRSSRYALARIEERDCPSLAALVLVTQLTSSSTLSFSFPASHDCDCLLVGSNRLAGVPVVHGRMLDGRDQYVVPHHAPGCLQTKTSTTGSTCQDCFSLVLLFVDYHSLLDLPGHAFYLC